MSENTPTHAASHRRLRRAKRTVVLAVAGLTAAVWALVATNTVGVTATQAADPSPAVNPVTPQVRSDGNGGQDGFFGVPNDQPGFFGGAGNGFSGNGFSGNGSSQGGSGGFGSGGFGGSSGSGSFGQGGLGGAAGPMMQSGGS